MKINIATIKSDLLKLNEVDLNITLNQIKEQLINYNIEYRKGNSIITDKQFDYLEYIYKQYKPNDEYFTKIGYEVENDKRKQTLPIVMASMNKIHSVIEIKKWCKSKNITNDTFVVISPKLDGNSITEDLDTKDAWTRGDGIVGRYSKEHVNIIESSNPNRNKYLDLIRIDNKEANQKLYTYGEVIISNKKFKDYSNLLLERNEELPSHPRNTIAGFINNDKPPKELEIVDYIRYGIVFKNGFQIDKCKELDLCNRINKVPIPYVVKRISELTEELLYNLYQKWNIDYEIDGLIIEVDSYVLRNKIGRETSTNNPGYARAYKGDFEEIKQTTLLKHHEDITKDGNLSLVASIDSIDLDGATINNVTLNNASYVIDYGLYPNVTIGVKRSGGVIPKIVSVNGHNIPFKYQYETQKEYEIAKQKLVNIRRSETNFYEDITKTCPSCNSVLEWDSNKVHLKCNNDNCNVKQFYKVVSFFNILNVDEVGEPTIKLLFDNGYNSVKKILELDKLTLETFDRVGKKKAEIIYNNIHSKMKNVKLEKLQHASNLFERLGSKKLKLINNYLMNNPSKKLTVENLITIDGISDKLANNYINNIDKFHLFLQNINSNKQFINIYVDTPIKLESNLLGGLNVVFSGVRNKSIEQIIIDHGGKIGSGISKKTSHLVMKQVGTGSSKEVKATKLGIDIMTIAEFNAYINNKLN